MRYRHTLVSLLAGFIALILSSPTAATTLTVSAASSLADALRELAPQFEARHPGARVQFNTGASGALLQQIVRGAPVDVFVTADAATMDDAQARGLVRAGARHDVASNTLVLVVPAGRASQVAGLSDLPRLARVAIGLPASVPAGRYAREALGAAGQWAAVEPRLIHANNVRQALDYVARGEVDAGFVYATDAALMRGKVEVAFKVPTPTPIRYPAAPLNGSAQPQAARDFVQFLRGESARAVFARWGFGPP